MVTDRSPRKSMPIATDLKSQKRIRKSKADSQRDRLFSDALEKDNSVQWLLQIARSRKLLTAAEEMELGRRVAEGDEDARRRLTEANLRLVVSVARRYVNCGIPLADLVQEGVVGLLRAIEKYDYRKGFRFSTYATWWIRQGVSRAVMEQRRILRLPVHISEELYRIDRAANRLALETGREATDEEIARALGESPQRVKDLRSISDDPLSLDAPMGEDDEMRMEDLLENDKAVSSEETINRMIHQEEVKAILEKLSQREKEILSLRYGLSGDEPQTLEEIGERFRLTRERIRQIEEGAFRKIRAAAHREEAKKVAAS